MGSHQSATPKDGYIHGNEKPFFNPVSSSETTITFDSGNSYKFPNAIMYYLIDTGTIIDHEGKFPNHFLNDVMNSSVTKVEKIQHRGETGPKARGELKKGDIGYCEQEDIDNPLSWQSNISPSDFIRKLLEIVPHLKTAQLSAAPLDSILSDIEPLISKGTKISPISVTQSKTIPTAATSSAKQPYRGIYKAAAPKKSRDGKSVEIELYTDSFAGYQQEAATIERILNTEKSNGPAGMTIQKLEVRGPAIIKIALPISDPNQGTPDASIEIAKKQLQDFISTSLPGIKQDKSVV